MENKQKFAIRKVSVGAASVMIGLAAGAGVAHASDTVENNEVKIESKIEVVKETENNKVTEKEQLDKKVLPKEEIKEIKNNLEDKSKELFSTSVLKPIEKEEKSSLEENKKNEEPKVRNKRSVDNNFDDKKQQLLSNLQGLNHVSRNEYYALYDKINAGTNDLSALEKELEALVDKNTKLGNKKNEVRNELYYNLQLPNIKYDFERKVNKLSSLEEMDKVLEEAREFSKIYIEKVNYIKNNSSLSGEDRENLLRELERSESLDEIERIITRAEGIEVEKQKARDYIYNLNFYDNYNKKDEFISSVESATTKEQIEKIKEQAKVESDKAEFADKLNKIINSISFPEGEYSERESAISKIREAKTIEEANALKEELLDRQNNKYKQRVLYTLEYLSTLTDSEKESIKNELNEYFSNEENYKIDERYEYKQNDTPRDNFITKLLEKIENLTTINTNKVFSKEELSELSEAVLKDGKKRAEEGYIKYQPYIFEELKQANLLTINLSQEEKDILKNSIYTAKYNSAYFRGPHITKLDTVAYYLNNFPYDYKLSSEQQASLRKELLKTWDVGKIEEKIKSTTAGTQIPKDQFEPLNLTPEERIEINALRNIDNKLALVVAKELSDINSFSGITEEDKNILKEQIRKDSISGLKIEFNKKETAKNSISNKKAQLLKNLYEFKYFSNKEKSDFRKQILNSNENYIYGVLESTINYTANNNEVEAKLNNKILTEEEKTKIKNDISNYINTSLKKLENNYRFEEKQSGKAVKALEPSVYPQLILSKLDLLEKLYSYNTIPSAKKEQFKKEALALENIKDVELLSATIRGAHEALEIMAMMTKETETNKQTDKEQINNQDNKQGEKETPKNDDKNIKTPEKEDLQKEKKKEVTTNNNSNQNNSETTSTNNEIITSNGDAVIQQSLLEFEGGVNATKALVNYKPEFDLALLSNIEQGQTSQESHIEKERRTNNIKRAANNIKSQVTITKKLPNTGLTNTGLEGLALLSGLVALGLYRKKQKINK